MQPRVKGQGCHSTDVMLCYGNAIHAKYAMDFRYKLQEHYYLKSSPLQYPPSTIQENQLVFVPIDLTDMTTVYHTVKYIQYYLQLYTTTTINTKIANERLGWKIPNQYINSVIYNIG